jgi:hypothetical protein
VAAGQQARRREAAHQKAFDGVASAVNAFAVHAAGAHKKEVGQDLQYDTCSFVTGNALRVVNAEGVLAIKVNLNTINTFFGEHGWPRVPSYIGDVLDDSASSPKRGGGGGGSAGGAGAARSSTKRPGGSPTRRVSKRQAAQSPESEKRQLVDKSIQKYVELVRQANVAILSFDNAAQFKSQFAAEEVARRWLRASKAGNKVKEAAARMETEGVAIPQATEELKKLGDAPSAVAGLDSDEDDEIEVEE